MRPRAAARRARRGTDETQSHSPLSRSLGQSQGRAGRAGRGGGAGEAVRGTRPEAQSGRATRVRRAVEVPNALGGVTWRPWAKSGGAHRSTAAGWQLAAASRSARMRPGPRYGIRGMQTAGPGREPRACIAYPGMGPFTVLLRGNTGSGADMLIAFLQPQDQCYAFFRVAPASSTALLVTRLCCGRAEGASFACRSGNTIHSFIPCSARIYFHWNGHPKKTCHAHLSPHDSLSASVCNTWFMRHGYMQR